MKESDYMQFCDVIFNEKKYRGVKFSDYRPGLTGSVSNEDNSIQDENGYVTGKTYWFLYEPLQWRVLDPSTGLIMSKTLIDSQPFNNFVLESSTFDANNNITSYVVYGNAAKTYSASNYAESSIRKWLNNNFYATAFSKEQQNSILINYNQNNDGYYTLIGSPLGKELDSVPTNDKIFLLSYLDVLNTSYGFSSNPKTFDTNRRLYGSDYAKCQGLWLPNSNGSRWWLRTAGKYCDEPCAVFENTYIYNEWSPVNSTSKGVCPALKLSLS